MSEEIDKKEKGKYGSRTGKFLNFLKKNAFMAVWLPVAVAIVVFLLNFVTNEIRIHKTWEKKVEKILSTRIHVAQNIGTIDTLVDLHSGSWNSTQVQSLLARNTKAALLEEDLFSVTGTVFNSPGKVFLINESANMKRYIPFKGEAENAVWSRDYSEILFQGKEKGKSRFGLYLYTVASDSYKELAYDKNSDYSEPTWTYDGTKILFCSNRNHPENEKIFDLFIMKSDGSDETLILETHEIKKKYNEEYLRNGEEKLEDISICLPTICPGDKCIGFSVTAKDRNWILWIMYLNKPESLNKISNWGYCRMKFNPASSGSDDEIVFVRDRTKSDSQGNLNLDIIIATLVTDSGLKKPILKNEFNLTRFWFENRQKLYKYPQCPIDSYPDWSLDGKQILFSSTQSKQEDPTNDNWTLHTMDRDGNNRKRFAGKKIKARFSDW